MVICLDLQYSLKVMDVIKEFIFYSVKFYLALVRKIYIVIFMEQREHTPADDPRPGYFSTKLVRGGPDLPARIFITPCHCTIGGGYENKPHDHQESCDRIPRTKLSATIIDREVQVYRVWTASNEISEEDYNFLLETAVWEKRYDNRSPYHEPNKPIDLNKTTPVAP